MMQDDFEERRQHNYVILSTLKQYYEEGKYWDVRVQVGPQVFKCHRAILAANSEYFDRAMSSDNSEESDDATAPETITLPDDVDSAVFRTLLHFMYTGEICAYNHNVVQLFVLNDLLGLRKHHFKERMFQYVRSWSEESTPMLCAIELLRYARDNEENVLVNIMIAYVYRHVYYFSEDAQLLGETSFEHLNALLESSKKYIVPLPGSNDVLLKIVHNWVNHNREVRSQYRLQLMKNVDFTKVSSDLTSSLMNTLENVVDEVSKVSSEDKSFPKLETLGAALEKVLLGAIYGIEGTICWNVPHIREVPIGEQLFSPSSMLSSLKWRLSLERSASDELDVYIHCEGTDLATEWNTYANATFTIDSNEEEGEGFVRHLNPKLFSSSKRVRSCVWVVISFMRWNELVDPQNGYIANDGSLSLNAYVSVGAPFLSYNSRSNIDNC